MTMPRETKLRDPLDLVGTIVGEKYQILELVGEGSFGLVYRADHVVWRQPVALKVFAALKNAPLEQRDQLLADFVREGSLLAELSAKSASVVQARDVATLITPHGEWMPYLVLEWLEGTTLDGHLAQLAGHAAAPVPWTPEAMLAIVGPLADALELVHRSGVVHRDVKPSNIFLLSGVPSPKDAAPEVPPARVKLLDFGIAKAVASAADLRRTSTGDDFLTAFTPAYGAPEQFSRKWGATGPATDIFALALVAVELLSGVAPLEGEDFVQLGIVACDPRRRPTPQTRGAQVSDTLEAVFRVALAVRPADRFQSAGAFLRALRAAVREGVAPVTVVQPLTRRSTVAKWTMGAATILAVAAGGTAALQVSKKPTAPSQPDVLVATAPPLRKHPAIAPCPNGMVAIPGGEFFQGSSTPPDRYAEDESPTHHVTLAPFCLDLTEVTVSAYKQCSDSGRCLPAPDSVDFPGVSASDRKRFSPSCTIRSPEPLGDHPINCVSWELAANFCARAGKRLPTEAEWEYAARGPDGRIYPWGNEPPDGTRLNACGSECVAWGKKYGVALSAMHGTNDGWPTTAPVGRFPSGASRYGVLDVVGNVWEWTADFYGPYARDDVKDPKGPATGEERVIRGGGWNGSYASWVRPSKRYRFAPEAKSHAIGFRCAAAANSTTPLADPSPSSGAR